MMSLNCPGGVLLAFAAAVPLQAYPVHLLCTSNVHDRLVIILLQTSLASACCHIAQALLCSSLGMDHRATLPAQFIARGTAALPPNWASQLQGMPSMAIASSCLLACLLAC